MPWLVSSCEAVGCHQIHCQSLSQRSTNVGSMLVHRPRRWPNIEPTVIIIALHWVTERLKFAGKPRHCQSPVNNGSERMVDLVTNFFLTCRPYRTYKSCLLLGYRGNGGCCLISYRRLAPVGLCFIFLAHRI